MNLNHNDLQIGIPMPTEVSPEIIQAITDINVDPKVEAKPLIPKYNKAQQIHNLLGNGYIANAQQVQIMNSKRKPPVLNEDDQKTADQKEAAYKKEVFEWNTMVNLKKKQRLERRLAKAKASLGIV
jgi:hypothetical protein